MPNFTIKDVFDAWQKNEYNHGSGDDLYPKYSKEDSNLEDSAFPSKQRAKWWARDIADLFNSFPDKFPIYRAIRVKTTGDIDKENLGASWSFDLDAAKEFGSHNGSNIILAGWINSEDVEWDDSLSMYIEFSSSGDYDSEYEIVVPDTSKIYDLQIMKKKEAKEIGTNPIFVKMKNENLIRGLIREEIESQEEKIDPKILTVDYFKKRIPFLNDYTIFHKDNIRPGSFSIEKDKYNSNVERVVPDREPILFSNYNIFSSFMYFLESYSKCIILRLKNNSVLIPKKTGDVADDLLSRVLQLATDKVVENSSTRVEIRLDESGMISKLEFDAAINKMNESFFKFEELSKSLEFNLF